MELEEIEEFLGVEDSSSDSFSFSFCVLFKLSRVQRCMYIVALYRASVDIG